MPRASRPRDPVELKLWTRTFDRIQARSLRAKLSAQDARSRALEAAWDAVHRVRYGMPPPAEPIGAPVGEPSPRVQQVLALVRVRPMRSSDVVEALGITQKLASKTLRYLAATGRIERLERGLYGAVARADVPRPGSPLTS